MQAPSPTEQQHTLGHVKDASEQLLSLIGDLLELTALKQRRRRYQCAELDPREPMKDAIDSGERTSRACHAERREPDIVPMMRSDRRRLRKRSRHLIENAFKFTREGRVRYNVSDRRRPGDLHRQRHGHRHSGGSAAFVFDEFRQVDGTRTREFGGSGLGLSLARRLAQLVQGEITLTSIAWRDRCSR